MAQFRWRHSPAAGNPTNSAYRLVGGLALAGAGASLAWWFCRRGGACDRDLRSETPHDSIESQTVDESSWESFPASDPPSFNRTIS